MEQARKALCSQQLMRSRLIVTVAAIAAAALCGVAYQKAAGAQNRPASTHLARECPTRALSLPADAVARAADQARRSAPRIYGRLGAGARIVAATVASAGNTGPRGTQVRRECGRRIAARTIIVDLSFPRGLPSASLSQGTVFVSRLPTGYAVWERAH
jgi:hypothetical protein